jgi:hypothetical protein
MIAPGSIATAKAASQLYSDPDWWPLHEVGIVDCTHSNDCPSGSHTEWGIDVVSEGYATDKTTGFGTVDLGVYAMGAGIAHIGDAHGKACGFGGGKSDFGTWVWVDHGGGVVSKYGHLSAISVKEGRQVQVGTKLGVMGHSGDASTQYCNGEPYVDFQVRHQGITGPSVAFATTDAPTRDGDLLICTTSGPQRVAEHRQPVPTGAGPGVYPDDSNTYHRIDDMRRKWTVIAGSSGCATATSHNGPAHVTLRASGSNLKVAWSKAGSKANAVRVEFDRHLASGWQPANDEKFTDLGPGSASTTEKSLHAGSRYRARVWFHTKQGWSTPSAWATANAP